MPRKADAVVIRGGWRAREGVTSDFVTARIGWPEARGGPCEARRLGPVPNRARVALRGFQSGIDSLWYEVRRQSREHPCSGARITPEPSMDSKAENARGFAVSGKEPRTTVFF